MNIHIHVHTFPNIMLLLSSQHCYHVDRAKLPPEIASRLVPLLPDGETQSFLDYSAKRAGNICLLLLHALLLVLLKLLFFSQTSINGSAHTHTKHTHARTHTHTHMRAHILFPFFLSSFPPPIYLSRSTLSLSTSPPPLPPFPSLSLPTSLPPSLPTSLPPFNPPFHIPPFLLPSHQAARSRSHVRFLSTTPPLPPSTLLPLHPSTPHTRHWGWGRWRNRSTTFDGDCCPRDREQCCHEKSA